MLVSDIPSFSTWLASTQFANDRLWSRHLEQISETEIQLFYARAGLRGLKREAAQVIDQLQTDLLLAAVESDVPQAALGIITHEPPRDRFTTDEFLDRLVKINRDRRAATLFALSTKQDPERVMELCWSSVGSLQQLSGLSKEILTTRSKTRHLRLPYVFWEWATPKIAAPLLMLRESAEDAFGSNWPTIQQCWSDMLWINASAERHDFLRLVDEVVSGKL